MSGGRRAVPSAWDDDWVNVADQKPKVAPQQPTKLSKAEKLAHHAQTQKQIWQKAEQPETPLFLDAQGVIPLKQDMKPTTMKVLSRKPAPSNAKRGGTNGMAGLSLDDDDEDSEEEARKKAQLDFEERQRRAKTEREEKVRKYAEARERIMGPSAPGSPAPTSRESSQGRGDSKRGPRGKGNGYRDGQSTSGGQSPARQTSGVSSEKQLFDPEDMSRRLPVRREANASPRQGEPTRQPLGPEGSSRGFSFAGRGGRSAV